MKSQASSKNRIQEASRELEFALTEFEKIQTSYLEKERLERLAEVKAQLQSIKKQLDQLT